MSKKNRIVDKKELERLQKQAEKVDNIKSKISGLIEQLRTIQENENWLNYLGEKATETLTQEQNWQLNEINEKIKYCHER